MNRRQYSLKQTFLWVGTLFLLLVSGGGLVSANTIAQGYVSRDSELKAGMVAALSSDSLGTEASVERASTSSESRVVGVVTNLEDNLISATSNKTSVYVTNSGAVTALVSDVNGVISKGDSLIASPVKGVLMKAGDAGGGIIIGSALVDFNTSTASKETINRQNGEKRDVMIGPMLVQLGSGNSQAAVANTLDSFGIAVTGKPVSKLRIIVAFVILLLLLLIEGIIVYGAVSSSIIAIGRNPLARKDIYKQLIQTLVVAIAILFVAVAGIYVVIWT